MARLSLVSAFPVLASLAQPRSWPRMALWGVRRLGRRAQAQLGAPGLVTLAALALVGASVWMDQRARAEIRQLSERTALLRANAAQAPVVPVLASDTGRQRLLAFEQTLPPHEDIPQVLGDLLTLAEQQGLLAQRGDYRAQPDVQGGFLRYRMTLPVSGEPAAIRRFVQKALSTQKSLALESVQFKRESTGDGRMEARIQWSLLTHLKGSRTALALPATVAEADAPQRASAAGGRR